jgi:GT2 family glycosyltransferase
MRGNLFVQVMAGEWIPLQAYLIQAAAFFEIGGFDPLMPVSQDVDLSRRIALRGDFADTPAVVACIRRGVDTSTTDYDRLPFYSRRARENILNEPGVFARMRASAISSYWQGRIVRAYLTSMVWNLQHRRLMTAVSRAAFGAASCGLALRYSLAKDFWRAIVKSHQSETFRRGFEQASRRRESAQ